jgi:hypothetical protein
MKKKQKPGNLLFWLLIGGLAAIVAFATAKIWQTEKLLNHQLRINRNRSLTGMTASAINSSLENTIGQLEIVAKFDEFSRLHRETFFSKNVSGMKKEADQAIDALSMDIANAYYQHVEFQQTPEYWQELIAALLRRASFEFFRLGGLIPIEAETVEDEDSGDEVFSSPDFNRISSPDFIKNSKRAISYIDKAYFIVETIYKPIYRIATRLDQLLEFGNSVLLEKVKCEKYLSTAINSRRWISGLRLVNLYGYSLLDHNETGIDKELNDYKICQKLASGRSCIVGPVYFAGEKKAYLQVALPVKNRQRTLSGCFRAAIDLEPIRELFSNSTFEAESELMLLDLNGNIIISSNPEREHNRISFIKSLAESKSIDFYQDRELFFKDPSAKKNIHMLPLSKFRNDKTPTWKVALVEKDPQISLLAFNIPDFALFVLAVTSIYVLFYSVLQLSKIFLQEDVDDN